MNDLENLKHLVNMRQSEPERGVPKPGFEGINFHPDSFYGDNYIRGRGNVMSYEEMRKLAQSRLAPDDFGAFWGGVYHPSIDATNFCIIGIPGSGKTTLIRLLMQSVLPLIGLKDKSKAHAQRTDPRYYAAKHGVENPDEHPSKIESHRALIFDIKPEYLTYLSGMNLNCPVKILDPYHLHSCVWETGRDIDDRRVRTFAKIFIPDVQQDGEGSRFFVDSARDVVANVLTGLNRSRKGQWTFCDFVDIMRQEQTFTELLRSYPDLNVALREMQARSETFQNVAQQIRTFIAEVESASNAWRHAKTRVSLKDWLDDEYILVLSRREEYRESVDPIYRLMFGVAASLGLSYDDSTTRRTWFFLDELGNAGELTNLSELMTMGRAKGISVVIGAQGISTLQRVFKTKEKVTEILELCPYIAILRAGDGGDSGTASWAEKLLGKCEFYETKTSASLAKAYTTGTTQTRTEGTNQTTNRSQASGTTQSKTHSNTQSEATTRGSTEGTSDTRTASSSSGHNSSSSGHSDAHSDSDSSSNSQTTSHGVTEGSSEGTTATTTTGSSEGTNTSTAHATNESESKTSTLTINRERLEKSLVHASQIASLKTLKYDGMLLGYFITPFSTYALALPGEYIKRALQGIGKAPTLYPTLGADNMLALSASEQEDLLAQRLARRKAEPIRDLLGE